MKMLDSDEEEEEQLGAYQKELRRKFYRANTAKERERRLKGTLVDTKSETAGCF